MRSISQLAFAAVLAVFSFITPSLFAMTGGTEVLWSLDDDNVAVNCNNMGWD